MCQVHLPVEHSDDDLLLAGQVAEYLESRSLYVTWSPGGYRRPVVETSWRDPDSKPPPPKPAQRAAAGGLGGALGMLKHFLSAALKPRMSS